MKKPEMQPEEPPQPENQESAEPSTLQQEKQELIEHLQRLQAEFDNYRRRVEREQSDMRHAASEKLLRDLLPIIDNLQLSINHAKEAENGDLLTGVIMIHEQLKSMLEHYDMTEIPESGRFDPRLHEALTMLSQEGVERGTIIQTFQRGYLRGGKVFRPAKVSVAK